MAPAAELERAEQHAPDIDPPGHGGEGWIPQRDQHPGDDTEERTRERLHEELTDILLEPGLPAHRAVSISHVVSYTLTSQTKASEQ